MVQLLAGINSLRRVRGRNPGRSHGSVDTLPLRHSANWYNALDALYKMSCQYRNSHYIWKDHLYIEMSFLVTCSNWELNHVVDLCARHIRGILLNENCCLLIENSLKFVPGDPTENESALVWVMAWCHQASSHFLNHYWWYPSWRVESPGCNELTLLVLIVFKTDCLPVAPGDQIWAGPVKFDSRQVKIIIDYMGREIFWIFLGN